jgi:hypothetical protein
MINTQKLLKWATLSSLVVALLMMIGCAPATAEPSLEPQETLASQTSAPIEQTDDGPTSTPEREVRTPSVTLTGTVQVTVVTFAPGTRNPTTAASSPGVPTATTQGTAIPLPTNSPSTGDSSGSQSNLSTEEQAAASAGTASYNGQRCRIAEDFTCNCIPDTITASFLFPDANAGQMIFNATTGSANYQLARKGVNTWITSSTGTTDQGTVTTNMEIIFNLTGFQQIVTVTFPGGQAPTCTANWTRQ